MTFAQRFIKRSFDLFFSFAGIALLWPAALIVAFLVKLSSPGPVLYLQKRIGRHGETFTCIKFRTMSMGAEAQGTVTTAVDSRITPVGKLLRSYKIDELPQLWNVLLGKMSFVGPRPDVPGYADLLEGVDREILSLRPGITGPASLFFRYEEQLLAGVSDPVSLNDSVIWPIKVAINRDYQKQWSFIKDLGYIIVTILPFLRLNYVPEPPRTPACIEAFKEKYHPPRNHMPFQ